MSGEEQATVIPQPSSEIETEAHPLAHPLSSYEDKATDISSPNGEVYASHSLSIENAADGETTDPAKVTLTDLEALPARVGHLEKVLKRLETLAVNAYGTAEGTQGHPHPPKSVQVESPVEDDSRKNEESKQNQMSLNNDGNSRSVPENCTSSEPAVQSECPVQPRLFYSAQKNQRYDMDEGKKGLVAIINLYTDEKHRRYRRGTIEDEERICRLFETGEFAHRYYVHKPSCIKKDGRDLATPWRDLKQKAFEDALMELVQMLKSKAYNSFFLFIMSHGGSAGIETFHEMDEAEYLTIDKINDNFKESIKGCPKVIVIQACRSPAYNADLDNPQAGKSQYPPDGFVDLSDKQENDMRVTIPDSADMLIALSTVKGYSSHRQLDGSGSWFLRYLFEQLTEAHKSKYYSSHLLKLLPEVLRLVADNTPVEQKHMPCFESTLTKKFYLLPPVLPH